MMESSQASFLAPDLISIPLEKFSHAASAPTSLSHQWIHESRRDDLYLVLQKIRVQEMGTEPVQERLVMSISSSGNIIERQDVGHLVEMTQRFESMSQTMALNTSKIDAPVQIVVKQPCIAMRYTKDPTKVQRIQMRFKSGLDYEKSLSIFKNMGLPVKEAMQAAPTAPTLKANVPNVQKPPETFNQSLGSVSGPLPNLYTAQMKEPNSDQDNVKPSSIYMPNPSDRPHSTSTETLRSSSAASQIWLQPDRISRPFSSSSSLISKPVEGSIRNGNEPSLYGRQILAHSLQEGVLPNLNQETFGGQQKFPLQTFQTPAPGLVNSSSSNEHNDRLTPKFPNSVLPSHDAVRHHSLSDWSSSINAQPRSGSVPSIYVSQMQASDQSQIANGPAPSSSVNSNYGPNSDHVLPQDPFKLGRSVTAPGSNSYIESSPNSSTVRNSSLPLQSQRDDSLLRPQSVPIHPEVHDKYWLPPKRELPFLKEREKLKNRNHSTTESVGSVKPKAAAPIQTLTPATSSSPAAPKKSVKRVAERVTKEKPTTQDKPKPSSPSPCTQARIPTPVLEEAPLTCKTVTAANPNSGNSSLSSSAVPSKRPSSAIGKPGLEVKRPKMIDQGTQTQKLPGCNHTAPLAELPINNVCENHNLATIPPPPSFLDQIDEFVRANASRPAPVDVFRTTRYSEISEEERRVMVDNWICENIENEDFLLMCEDSGHSWRRTGAGF